jgi:hypothetical protein
MANTWTANYQGVAFAATKNMGALLNGGARVLRVYRIGALNIQTAAVTGVICLFDVRRYAATAGLTSPTAVTPVSHDSTNAGLTSVTCGHAGTISGTPSVFRRIIWSSDEPKLTTAQNNEWECIVPLNIIWDCGYGDSNCQPLVVRQNEMWMIYNTSGAAGLLDVWVEFTDAAS